MGVPVTSQIITGNVLMTLVEHTFSSTSLTMYGIYHYHTGKGSHKNLQTSFPEWSVVPLESFALMGKTLFYGRQNPDSMMDDGGMSELALLPSMSWNNFNSCSRDFSISSLRKLIISFVGSFLQPLG